MRTLVLSAPLLLALGSCSLARSIAGDFARPRLTYESWSAEALDLDGVTISLRYRLENPNGFGLDLERLSYRLEVEGRQVGEGALAGGLHVPANGATALVVPARLRWRDLPAFVETLLTRRDIAYRISGEAGVGSPLGVIGLPFEHADRVALPRLPSFSIEDVTVQGLSTSQLSLDLRLRIENGNAFPLPVGALTYGLRLGGEDLLGGTHPLAAVPPGGHAVVTVPIRVSLSALAGSVRELLDGAELRLRGLADYGGLEAPVDAPGRVAR